MFNLRAHGKTAVRRLADLGVLTPGTVLEHFVWVTDEDLRVFADSGAGRVQQPGLQPPPVHGDLPGPGHHGGWRPDRVRDRRHLVL